jgi:uncharacterized membrane protein
MAWRNIVNALIGIWFIISSWVLAVTAHTAAMWTSIAGGAIFLILAGTAALNPVARRQAWIQYVNGLVGIWFIIAPWVLGFANRPTETWTSWVPGAIALILSAWNLGVLPRRTAEVQQQQHAH